MKNTNTGVKKCFISLLSDPVLHFFEDLRGIKLEEVEVHRLGDAKQQVAIWMSLLYSIACSIIASRTFNSIS